LNAAGRLEDAALGVELLLGDEPSEVQALAELLDGFNRDRQKLEQQTLEQAIARLEEQTSDAYSIVLADERWHSGVIGIVASRLVERYHRPTVLIALDNGIGKGSCRSISGFNLYQALLQGGEALSGFGGHAMAAGLSIAEEKISEFAADFERVARAHLQPSDLDPKISHDGECRLTELTRQQVTELEQLNPFGAGNPQPCFYCSRCQVLSARVLGEKHLKFEVEQDGCRIGCIAFGMAERFDQLAGPVDLLFRPGINSWRGQDSVQLQVVDFQASAKNC
jgi:single-stranded-DNA-specific exonuclease